METVLWTIAIVVQLIILPRLSKRAFRNYLRRTYSSEELQHLLKTCPGILSIPNMENFLYFHSVMYVFVTIGIDETLGTAAGLVFMVVLVFMSCRWMYKEADAFIQEDANKLAQIKI